MEQATSLHMTQFPVRMQAWLSVRLAHFWHSLALAHVHGFHSGNSTQNEEGPGAQYLEKRHYSLLGNFERQCYFHYSFWSLFSVLVGHFILEMSLRKRIFLLFQGLRLSCYYITNPRKDFISRPVLHQPQSRLGKLGL